MIAPPNTESNAFLGKEQDGISEQLIAGRIKRYGWLTVALFTVFAVLFVAGVIAPVFADPAFVLLLPTATIFLGIAVVVLMLFDHKRRLLKAQRSAFRKMKSFQPSITADQGGVTEESAREHQAGA